MTRRFWLPAVVLVSAALASALPAEEPKPRITYEGHSSTVLSVAFSPDGKTVASAARQPGTFIWVIALWDAETGKKVMVAKANDYPIRSVCFSPDGKQVAAAGEFGAAARVYDVETGKERLVIPYPEGLSLRFMQVGYSPDGKTIAASAGLSLGPIFLYDAATGKKLAEMAGGRFAFSPDGKTLARWGQSPKVLLWDLAAGKERDPIETRMRIVKGVAFGPDGKTLVAGSNTANESDLSLEMWDMATGKELPTLKGHTISIMRVAFSPDGRTVASASPDNTVRLWDLATGREIALFKDHALAIAFSPDGRTLASGGADSKVRLWVVPERKQEGK
jgi:WD40 repeat protein